MKAPSYIDKTLRFVWYFSVRNGNFTQWSMLKGLLDAPNGTYASHAQIWQMRGICHQFYFQFWQNNFKIHGMNAIVMSLIYVKMTIKQRISFWNKNYLKLIAHPISFVYELQLSMCTSNLNECSNLNVKIWGFSKFWSDTLIQLSKLDLN